MAFNESELPAVTSTGLSSASRGIDPNDAFGKLFSGLGQTMSRGLQAYDTTLRTNLEIDTFQAADQLVNENMPPSLAEAQGDIQKLVTAKNQGKLSEVEFTAKVAQRAKQIRSRLPDGYQPLVDPMLSSALGSSTANDHRKARLAELQAAQESQDAGIKERRKYIESNEALIQTGNVKVMYKRMTGKDLMEDVSSGDYNYAALQYAISAQKSADFERDAAMKAIEFNGKAAGPAARKLGGQLLNKVFNDQVGAPFGDWLKQVAAAQAASSDGGVDITKEEKLAMTQVWNNIRTSSQQEYLRLISSPEFANVDSSVRGELKQMFEQQVALYDSALTDQNFGLLTALQREASYIKESDLTNMLRESSEARRATLGKSLGLPDVVMESIFTTGSAAVSRLDADLTRVVTGEALVGDRGVMDLIENTASKDTKNVQTVVQGTVRNLQALLNSPKIVEEDVPVIAARIFRAQNYDLLKKLEAKDRAGTFRTFLTPRVIEAVKKDPDAFAKMSEWATVQFDAISKTARDTMIEAQQSRGDVTFDGKRFAYKAGAPSLMTFSHSWDLSQQAAAGRAVADMNTYAQVMEPIWAAQDLSIKEGLNMTFQMKIQDVPKAGSMFDAMGKAIKQFFTDEEKPASETPKAGKDKRSGIISEPEANLLGFVQVAEGASYNTMFGGTQAELEKMTVGDVLAFNKSHGRKTGSSATGAYQIMHNTLKDLVAAGVVDEDEMFTADVQDRAALALLNRRGYSKFKSGKLSAEKFADNLASEWASLPNASGKSQYDGDKMGNKATVRRQSLMDAIASL